MSGSRSKKSGGKYDNPTSRKVDKFAKDEKSTAGKLKSGRKSKEQKLKDIMSGIKY